LPPSVPGQRWGRRLAAGGIIIVLTAVEERTAPASILLLDHDPSIRTFLADVLSSEGYRVYPCASVRELRQRRRPETVSLAIVDAWGRSHHALDEAERHEIATLAAEIPTIMVTGRQWAAITSPAELGLRGLLPKPFDLDELLALLKASVEELRNASARARAEARKLRDRVDRAHDTMHLASHRLTEAAIRAQGGNREAPSSRRQLRMLQALLALDVTSLEAAMQRTAHDLAEILLADKVDVFVYDATSDELVAIGTSDTPMGRRQHELGLNRMPLTAGGRAVQIFQSGLGALVRYSEHDPEELPSVVHDLGVRSMLGVPLNVTGERRGLLLVASAIPAYFFDDDLAFLETVARWLGLVGDRVALVQRLTAEAAEAGYRAGVADTVSTLTPRQREVAALVAQGLSNAEIAARLWLTRGTVANHIAQIMRRLGVRRRSQIATWATRHELDGAEPIAGQLDGAEPISGQ